MSGTRKPRGRSAGERDSNRVVAGRKSADAPAQGHVCLEPGCGKVCRSASGLVSHRRAAHVQLPVESPTAAVERVLGSVLVTSRHAVLAAQVRTVARALEECDASDVAKTSKELSALMKELLAAAAAKKPEPDWTEE